MLCINHKYCFGAYTNCFLVKLKGSKPFRNWRLKRKWHKFLTVSCRQDSSKVLLKYIHVKNNFHKWVFLLLLLDLSSACLRPFFRAVLGRAPRLPCRGNTGLGLEESPQSGAEPGGSPGWRWLGWRWPRWPCQPCPGRGSQHLGSPKV